MSCNRLYIRRLKLGGSLNSFQLDANLEINSMLGGRSLRPVSATPRMTSQFPKWDIDIHYDL